MRRIRMVLCATAIMHAGMLGGSVGAQPDYQLEQIIDPIICTSTSMNNGTRIWVTSSCDESYIPTITEVIVTETSLILRGKFDAQDMRVFRIKVFEKWYEYGKSPLLTASGNDWQLNLSSLRAGLQPGSYDVVLEFMTNSSVLYQDTIQNHITIPIKSLPVEPPVKSDSPTPSASNLADTGDRMAVSVIVGVILISIGIIVLKKKQL